MITKNYEFQIKGYVCGMKYTLAETQTKEDARELLQQIQKRIKSSWIESHGKKQNHE